MSDKSDELLNIICKNASLNYLSDIHFSIYRASIAPVIQSIPDWHYTVSDWCVAASYILGEPINLSSVENIKEYLCTKLNGAK